MLGAVVLAASCASGENDGTGKGAGGGAADASFDGDAASTDGAGMPDVYFDSGPGDSGGSDGGAVDECVPDEACDDGLDNDCDGDVDEECPCVPGTVAPCYRGPASTRGLGECSDGTMTCFGSTEFGLWGPCEGDALPGDELCDDGAVDENCSGEGNEGCECSTGQPPIACGSDEGRCQMGTQECLDGKLGPCLGAIFPLPEDCNAVDDDCDGAVDEGLTRLCGASIGVCSPGTQRCLAGDWGTCEGGNPGGAEACNGADDDCNGAVDDGLTEPCGSGVGACVEGTRTCNDGTFGACTGAVGPTAETCNGIDDDCDGQVDNGLTRPCGSDVGLCVSGTETCSNGSWGACAGETPPSTEICDGTNDEDCDGAVDNGCLCTANTMRPCGTNVGACSEGTQTCDSNGSWGPCVGGTGPSPEVCDGVDNDCNNQTDEGCNCVNGQIRNCGTDVGECEFGTETCDLQGVWGLCTGGQGPTPEVCNMLDDDCDTQVDEGGVCPKFPPTVSCPGNQSTLVGNPVALNGSGSDPDGGSVTFAWSVTSAPVGSSAMPSPSNAASTSFNPDVPGTYVLQLCATDDENETRCCTVQVTATSPCTEPATPTVATCPTSWDRRPVVEFTPVPSGIFYEVWRNGDASPLATVSTSGQNWWRPASALGAGSPPPGTTIELYVRACRSSDPTCCSTSALVPTDLVESCATPIPPTSSNIVFSEYLVNGDGGSCPGATCEAGEAIEITNLSHCPVTLDGHHFGYQNPTGGANRWMDFGASDIIPPRGVYVAIRNQAASTCTFPFFGPDDPSLFGIKISALAMQGSGLTNGWFNNNGGGTSVMRIATGAWVDITSGTTIAVVSPYTGNSPNCESIGFDAIDACGVVAGGAVPTDRLLPNQLGRLWKPCDAVASPVPATCN